MTIHEAIAEAIRLSGKRKYEIAADIGAKPNRITEYLTRVEPGAARLADIMAATGCRISRAGGEADSWEVATNC